MRIYNHLFYQSFLLAKRSGNFKDIPVLGGVLLVSLCAMFNISSIVFVIEGIFGSVDFEFKREYIFLLAFIWVIFLLIYYSYKGRYKKIVEYYEEKEINKTSIHPIFICLIYYVLSACFLLIAGNFRNHTWIFS